MSPEFTVPSLDSMLRKKRSLRDVMAIGHVAGEARECDQKVVVNFHLLPPKRFENRATESNTTPPTRKSARVLCRAGVNPACARAGEDAGAAPPVRTSLTAPTTRRANEETPAVTVLTTPPEMPWAPAAFCAVMIA